MQPRPRPQPILAEFPWSMPIELRFADTDRLGHVNNGAFGSLMETSRCVLLQVEGLRATAETHFVLARFEIDYRREMHWPGTVDSAVRVGRIGNTSIAMTQALFRDGDCVALAQSIIVLIDQVERRPAPIPPAMRAAFSAYC